MKTIKVLDFDGPICNPKTLKYHEQIPEALKKDKENGYILCIASYNPSAKDTLQNWKLDHYFSAIRCGSNKHWSENYREKYGEGMRKSKQILDIFENELSYLLVEKLEKKEETDICFTREEIVEAIKKNNIEIQFYDDTHDNLEEVQTNLEIVKTQYIDPNIGYN